MIITSILFSTLWTISTANHQPAPAGNPVSEPVAKNILDYYRELNGDYAPGYEIRKKGEGWVSQSTAEYEIPVTVDIKNGFIELTDEGTGGGTFKVQVVLFRLVDGSPQIGITKTEFDGIGANQQYYFVRPEDSKQYDWTEHAVPIITYLDFYQEEDDEIDPELAEKTFPILFDLPQHGTSLKVSIFLGNRILYCSEDAGVERAKLCPLFDHMARESFNLKWINAEGRVDY